MAPYEGLDSMAFKNPPDPKVLLSSVHMLSLVTQGQNISENTMSHK